MSRRQLTRLHLGDCTVELRRMRDTADGRGRESFVAGERSARLELLVDVQGVFLELAARALHSKARRSRALSGAVEVRVVRGTEREVPR